MTTRDLIRQLREQHRSPWTNCSGANHLSLRNLFSHMLDSGVTPPVYGGKRDKSSRIRLLWGTVIDELFAEHIQSRSISEKSQKQYLDDFYNASDTALKNARWLHRLLISEALADPRGTLRSISVRLRALFPGEHAEALRTLAGSFGFSCLYSWYYGKEEQEQDIWGTLTDAEKSLARIEPQYLLTAELLLTADPAALLARCVFAVSAQCWGDIGSLEKLWLLDEDEILAYSEHSQESACYAAALLLHTGREEPAQHVLCRSLTESLDAGALALLLQGGVEENILLSFLLRGCSGSIQHMVFRAIAARADSGDGYAGCLVGRALFHHRHGDDPKYAWLNQLLAYVPAEQSDERILHYFEQSLQGPQAKADPALQAQCLFYMGKLRDVLGDSQQALELFERVGSLVGADSIWTKKAETARRNSRLLSLARGNADSEEVYDLPIPDRPSRYVFLMGTSEPYQSFISTLPTEEGGWNIVLPDTPKPPYSTYYSYMPCSRNRLYTLRQDLFWAAAQLLREVEQVNQLPQMLFAFFEADQEKNIRLATQLLIRLSGRLEAVRQTLRNTPDSVFHQYLSGIRVYVRVQNDSCANLLDPIQKMLYEKHGFYIPVNIINPYTHAAQWLFAHHPLFLPFLRESESDRPLNLVVLGTGSHAIAVVREAMALPVARHPVVIHVVGADGKHAMRRFRQTCPALLSHSWLHSFVDVRFYDCPLDELPLYDPADTDELAAVLCTGDYYVAATEDDRVNVELGIRLRESILARRGNSYTCEPLIAAQCTDSMYALLMDHLPISTGGSDHWYSSYRIRKFGTGNVFSWYELEHGLIESRARRIHLSYCSTKPGDGDASYSGLLDYYLRYYNRSSSRSTAVSLSYRAFVAGICLEQELYGIPQHEADLGKRYHCWLYPKNDAPDPWRLEQAAQAEQLRWCLQLVSNGWQTASAEQVHDYLAAGNPSHQLHIARLHPYLVPWEKLRDTYDQVRHLWKSRRKKELKDPCVTTKKSITASPMFFIEGSPRNQ